MTWPRVTHVELPWTVSPDVTMSARALMEVEFFAASPRDAAGMGTAGHGVSTPRIKGNAPLIVANAKLMAAAANIGGDLDVEGLLAMHDVLLRPSAPDIAGKLRDGAVCIGGDDLSPAGAFFVPPAVDDVPALIEDLLAFLRRDDLPAFAGAAGNRRHRHRLPGRQASPRVAGTGCP